MMINALKKIWKWIVVAVFGGVVLAATLGPNDIDIVDKYDTAPQEIKNEYSIVDNSLKISNDKEKDRLDIFIGGKDMFEPKMRVERWDNEVSFSIKLIENETGNATLSFDKEKIIWEKGNIKIEYFEVEDSYKFVWYLDKKPVSNRVEFEIESRGVDFYYQPELTQKEIDEGDSQPENVIGSYAVYHNGDFTNWVGETEYKVGKVGHIYRPRLKDSNNWEIWGELNIQNGIYQVTIPQDFYDNAVYPIRSNDTFGETSRGGTQSSASGNDLYGGNFVAPADADSADSITVWLDCFCTGFAKGVIVLESTLAIVSNGIGNPSAEVDSSPAEYTSEFSTTPTLSPSTEYVLMYIADNFINHYYDAGAAAGNFWYRDTSNNYSSPTDPSDSPIIIDERIFSIYATYTPVSGRRRSIIIQ